jgi:2-polyprenyl-6-methoxyphenol hydroxylase-like FAD-dependent oxidoreductase
MFITHKTLPQTLNYIFPVKTNLNPGFRGLSSAIALSKLPSVEVTIYEQARELREIGAGIQIGYNCWKVLELLGAAASVKGHVQETITHRYFKSPFKQNKLTNKSALRIAMELPARL